MSKRNAVICEMTEDGLVFAKETVSNRWIGFTFRQIPGYRGQSLREVAREFGIKPGVAIRVAVNERDAVLSVELAPSAPEVCSESCER